MRLTQYEINTPLWSKLVAYYTPKLATYRARLENTTTSDEERRALAWQIKGIKELLAMGEPAQGNGDGA